MTKTCTLIFPHQLFSDHPAIHVGDSVVLIEDSLFFGDEHYPARFHKQKLVLHRASMKRYGAVLEKDGFDIRYISYVELEGKSVAAWMKILADKGVGKIRFCNPVDFMLNKRIRRSCEDFKIESEVLDSPNFINTDADNNAFFEGKKRYFMADFYKKQRTRLGILLEEDGESPIGGQWSYDEDNRKKLPKGSSDSLPEIPQIVHGEYVAEAIEYVNTHFANNYGEAEDFWYPISHHDAEDWLDNFLEHRFADFGPYEDAIEEGVPFLYHSLLTPVLNIGLLSPMQIVQKAIDFAEKHDTPIASVEGFVRQIIGWREYMRATYVREGVSMRTGNHWQHQRPMPEAFYTGETGIVPLDDAIQRTLKYAYTHHIERLMVMGGFMFICRIDPKAIYTWFMELFIDAYDWVMVPNVYAMSQNSAGGIITTKPYFSGSNYVRKMSHYKKDGWCDTWDGLYWKFIIDHSESLANNPRWAMMVSMARRMKDEKREAHLMHAEKFLDGLGE